MGQQCWSNGASKFLKVILKSVIIATLPANTASCGFFIGETDAGFLWEKPVTGGGSCSPHLPTVTYVFPKNNNKWNIFFLPFKEAESFILVQHPMVGEITSHRFNLSQKVVPDTKPTTVETTSGSSRVPGKSMVTRPSVQNLACVTLPNFTDASAVTEL